MKSNHHRPPNRRSDYVIALLALAAIVVLIVGALTVWRYADNGNVRQPIPSAPVPAEGAPPGTEAPPAPDTPSTAPTPAEEVESPQYGEYVHGELYLGPEFDRCLPDGATMYTDGTYYYLNGPHCWPIPEYMSPNMPPAELACDYPEWRARFDPDGTTCG